MSRGMTLTVRGIRIKGSGRVLLDVPSLCVEAGECVGLIGSNGAGKTTLLRTCIGLLRPDEGRVFLDGRDVFSLTAWHRSILRRQIGYVPQRSEYAADLPFTVREVVTMGRTCASGLLARPTAEDRRCVDHWLEVLGLARLQGRTFRSLSGGEQQKVLMARAMVQEPRILFLDEPCSNLDLGWRYQITETLDRLSAETQVTILMVSHDLAALPGRCRRLVLLHQGKVLTEGDLDTVSKSGHLDDVYGCHVRIAEQGPGRYVVGSGGG